MIHLPLVRPLLLALLVAVAAPLVAQGPPAGDRLLALGNRLLAEGDPDGAVAAYDSVAATGWTSGTLAYNLGVAHLQAGRLGPAVLHLERARRLLPGDEAVAGALRLAHERAGTAEASRGAGGWGERLALPALVALAAALGLAAVGLRLRGARRSVGLGLALGAVLAYAAAAALWVGASPPAVVQAETALHEAPSDASAAGVTLGPGRLVRVERAAGDWRRVRAGEVSGWVPADVLEGV